MALFLFMAGTIETFLKSSSYTTPAKVAVLIICHTVDADTSSSGEVWAYDPARKFLMFAKGPV